MDKEQVWLWYRWGSRLYDLHLLWCADPGALGMTIRNREFLCVDAATLEWLRIE